MAHDALQSVLAGAGTVSMAGCDAYGCLCGDELAALEAAISYMVWRHKPDCQYMGPEVHKATPAGTFPHTHKRTVNPQEDDMCYVEHPCTCGMHDARRALTSVEGGL